MGLCGKFWVFRLFFSAPMLLLPYNSLVKDDEIQIEYSGLPREFAEKHKSIAKNYHHAKTLTKNKLLAKLRYSMSSFYLFYYFSLATAAFCFSELKSRVVNVSI
jgi:hypothetical protein